MPIQLHCQKKGVARGQSLFKKISFLFSISMLLCSSFALAQRTLLAWEFNTAGDCEGWATWNDLDTPLVAQGKLYVTTKNRDPYIASNVFASAVPATAAQIIELRMRSPRTGLAEFFWTNTTETQYGGFWPGKQTRFRLKPGWHTYYIRPFWQGEKQIIRLRLDFPGILPPTAPQTYEIDYIRIVELAAGELVKPEWDFAEGAEGWTIDGPGHFVKTKGTLVAELGQGGRLISPPLTLKAEDYAFVSFAMSVNTGHMGNIGWASDNFSGLRSWGFFTLADNRTHIYNVPVFEARNAQGFTWQGQIQHIIVEPTEGLPCRVCLKWLRVCAEPAGPAELQIKDFLIQDPLPRVGRPFTVLACVVNRGGAPLSHLHATLQLPAGVYLEQGQRATKVIRTLRVWEPQKLTWRVIATRAGPLPFRIRIKGAQEMAKEIEELITVPPPLNTANYVPPPEPASSEYEIGAYYFPGWNSWKQWLPISDLPERRPVLGYYHEGLPEVADWHIKWAVEHGLTFFCYDWYWDRGRTWLTHALHEGYFQARYRQLLKFCLLWANHAPTKHTPEDNEAVCQYWIEHYFRRPEYFKINGRPLLIIFAPLSLKRDLGEEGTRQCLQLWRRMTREANVGELFVAACAFGWQGEEIKALGFDALTGYTWPACGVEGTNWTPYRRAVQNWWPLWWTPHAHTGLPVLVPTSSGWDARPWQGANAFVLTQCTPPAFAAHLRFAQKFIQRMKQPRVVLIEAWNEWGEGAYCEPHKEFGFGHLDAVRRIFCGSVESHQDYTPADVGRPLLEFTPPAPRTEWDFDNEGDAQGWMPMQNISDFKVVQGLLEAKSTTTDPALETSVELLAGDWQTLEIVMAVSGATPNNTVQLFWTRWGQRDNEKASVSLPLVPDGQIHTYRFHLAGHPQWRGLIHRLRLDPCNTSGALIQIDRIRLVP